MDDTPKNQPSMIIQTSTMFNVFTAAPEGDKSYTGKNRTSSTPPKKANIKPNIPV